MEERTWRIIDNTGEAFIFSGNKLAVHPSGALLLYSDGDYIDPAGIINANNWVQVSEVDP